MGVLAEYLRHGTGTNGRGGEPGRSSVTNPLNSGDTLAQYFEHGLEGGSPVSPRASQQRAAQPGGQPISNPLHGLADYWAHGIGGNGSGPSEKQKKSDGSGQPGFAGSALRIAAARVLMSDPASGGESLADSLQHGIFDEVEKYSRKIGVTANIEVPTLTRVQEEAEWVLSGYRDLLPAKSRIKLTEADRSDLIDEEALRITKALFTGRMDAIGSATEEERSLALMLMLESQVAGPDELRQKLWDITFQRAQDFASNSFDAQMGREFTPTSKRHKQLIGKPPRTYFVADWLTQRLALTPAERTKFQNSFWGFGSTDIWIRRISEKEDLIRIPYMSIQPRGGGQNGSTGGFIMTLNLPDYADRVRKGAGWFRFVADRFVQDIGGTIQFVSPGREGLDRAILVRDPEKVTVALNRMIKIAKEFQTIQSSMATQAKEQNLAIKPMIRPQVVTELLPDPTILDAPTVWSGGRRDIFAEALLLHEQEVVPKRRRVGILYVHDSNKFGTSREKWPPDHRKAFERMLGRAQAAEDRAKGIIAKRQKYLSAPSKAM